MKLIFVYDANEGFWSKTLDFAHKIIKPSTYACGLCKLTHGNFVENEEWRTFRETAVVEMEFCYKEEFYDKYPDMNNIELPLVLFECVSEPVIEFITARDFNEIKSTGEFVKLVEARLRNM